MFEIITETNANWWTGRHNGKQGLFPSNYVEKINHPVSSPQLKDASQSVSQGRNFPSPSYAPQYQPPVAAPVVYQPPPPNQQVVYNPYMGSPGNMVAQPPPEQVQPPKRGRFGGMGNTVSLPSFDLLIESLMLYLFDSLHNRPWVGLVLVQVLRLGVVSSIQFSREWSRIYRLSAPLEEYFGRPHLIT